MTTVVDYRDIDGEAAGLGSVAVVVGLVTRFLKRQWRCIALFIVLGAAAMAGFLWLAPMPYTSSATILIDTRKIQLFQQPAVVGDVSFETHAAIESQIEILRSDTIAQTVIDKLGLDHDPEFAVKEGPGPIARLLGRTQTKTEEMKRRYRLDRFAGLLSVRRIGGTYAVEISFQSDSPQRAAQVANAVAEAYISDFMDAKSRASRRAGDWLQQRLTELRAQSSAAHKAVVDFKSKHGIFDTGGKLIIDQQVGELSSQLIASRARTSEVRARLDRAVTSLRDYSTAKIKPIAAEQLNNPLTSKLREQYFELANREVEYTPKYGPNHEVVIKLRKRLNEIRSALREDFEQLVQSYESELSIALRREQGLEQTLSELMVKARSTEQAKVELRELESAAQSTSTLYDGFLRKHSETVEQELIPIVGARMISRASQPLTRTVRKPVVFSALLLFGSIGFGLALALFRDMKDRTFRTSQDIESNLSIRFITLIPVWRGRTSLVGPAGSKKNLLPAPAEHTPRFSYKREILRAARSSPRSQFAESVRWVKQAVDREAEKGNKVIGLASVLPGEGASTLAAVLAQALQKPEAKTILVDCDLRNPQLTRDLARDCSFGIMDVAKGAVSLEDAVIKDDETGLHFLPGVVDGRDVAQPDQVLGSADMRRLFDQLRLRYDYIIVDLPPMFPMLDVSMTGQYIDSYVVVVEWGASRIDTVTHALARTSIVQKQLLGVVLNKVDLKKLRLYDGNAADYYDPKRYARYNVKSASNRQV